MSEMHVGGSGPSYQPKEVQSGETGKTSGSTNGPLDNKVQKLAKSVIALHAHNTEAIDALSGKVKRLGQHANRFTKVDSTGSFSKGSTSAKLLGVGRLIQMIGKYIARLNPFSRSSGSRPTQSVEKPLQGDAAVHEGIVHPAKQVNTTRTRGWGPLKSVVTATTKKPKGNPELQAKYDDLKGRSTRLATAYVNQIAKGNALISKDQIDDKLKDCAKVFLLDLAKQAGVNSDVESLQTFYESNGVRNDKTKAYEPIHHVLAKKLHLANEEGKAVEGYKNILNNLLGF